MEDDQLDPIDDAFLPLAQAVGRAVLGAAALEKVLLVDILNRSAKRKGLRDELEREIAELERRPAGVLLERLRELGLSADMARRVESVIARRNELIHRFMEEPSVIRALMVGSGINELVGQVDGLAIECQQVINTIAPDAFEGLQAVLGISSSELVDVIMRLNLDAIADPRLREQFATLHEFKSDQLKELLNDVGRSERS